MKVLFRDKYFFFLLIIFVFSFLFQIQKVFAITSVITSVSDFSASSEVTNVTIVGTGNSGSIKLSTTTIPVGDQYLLPITINNTGNSNDLYSNIVSFELNTATLITGGKIQSDCGDIRMRDSNKISDLREMDIALCNTANTIVSVKVPFIPKSSSKIIYLYYGSISTQTSIAATIATGTISLIIDSNHLHGTAVDNGGGVVKLNTADIGGHGQLSYGPADLVLGTNFDVSFDFSASGGCCNNIGADATYFFAYNNSATPQGEDAVNGGYSINFDEYNGSPQGQIQLNYNGNLLKAISKTGMSYSGYHTARIKKTNTRFEVYYDGVKMMDYTDIVRNTSGQYYGFGSRNAGQTNTHLIKNMSINDVFSTALPLPSVSVGTEEVATIPVYQDGVWISSKLDYGIIGKWGDSTGGSEAVSIDISGLNSNRLVDIYMRTSSNYWDIESEPFINIGSTTSDGTFTKLTSDLNTAGLIAKEYVQFKTILSQTDGVSPAVDSITVNYINATIPEAPTNLRHVSGTYDNFVFGWTPPVDDGGYIFDYKILYREPSVSSSWTTFTIGSPTTTYAFSNSFLPNHTFEFKVIAYNSAGEGVTSDIFLYTFPASSNYNITSCSELQNINNDKYSSYTLTKDLDCSETSTWNSQQPFGDGYYGFSPIGDSTNQFIGSFDGGNHTISGLYINLPNNNYVGLFGVINEGGSVSNLGLTNVNITGNYYVGALAGGLAGTVTNSYSTGAVNGYEEVGGLVGRHVAGGNFQSSPLVYTWNGSKYDFIGDVGRSLSRNVTGDDNLPIEGTRLLPKNGKYSVNVSQEYNEIVYYDELALKTFDHAPGYKIATSLQKNKSNEFYTIKDNPTNPLISCTDRFGNNCLSSLNNLDNKWSEKGDMNDTYWTLNFGDLSAANRILLITNGAEDGYAKNLHYVQVKNTQGNWVNAYSGSELSAMGGSPRTQVIDLTNKFLTNNYEVRVGYSRTRMNYFAIDTTEQQTYTVNTYHPTSADLHFFGYTSINNEFFLNHDYSKVSSTSKESYASQIGNFTKYGDVSELLQSTDDQFVIMHHGDQISAEFQYVPPAEGMERDFVLYNYDMFKHAKLGAIGRTVEPLPFRGMTKYPYSVAEKYPLTSKNLEYLRRWNTRMIFGTLFESSTIINSHSTAKTIGVNLIGGLVGYNEKTITGSYATGDVESTGSDTGGLVGRIYDVGLIENSYSTGNVTGYQNIGGFVGNVNHQNVIIKNSYSIGNANAINDGTNVGGFIGFNSGKVENSYSTGNVSGYDNLGGAVMRFACDK